MGGWPAIEFSIANGRKFYNLCIASENSMAGHPYVVKHWARNVDLPGLAKLFKDTAALLRLFYHLYLYRCYVYVMFSLEAHLIVYKMHMIW